MNNQAEIRQTVVNFAPDMYNMLLQLAQERGVSTADALRDAILLNKRLLDMQRKEGATLLIERNGKVRERIIDL